MYFLTLPPSAGPALHVAINASNELIAVATPEGNIALRELGGLQSILTNTSSVITNEASDDKDEDEEEDEKEEDSDHEKSATNNDSLFATNVNVGAKSIQKTPHFDDSKLSNSMHILNTVGVRSRSKIIVLKYANLLSNSNLLVAVYKNGEVYIITNPHDPTKYCIQQLFKHSKSLILDCCFSADDQLLAFTTSNNEILIWDNIYSKFIANLNIHSIIGDSSGANSPVKGICFDRVSNNTLITLGDDKVLNVIKYQLVHDEINGRNFKYEIVQIHNSIIQSAKLNKFSIKKLSWSVDDYVFSVPNTSKMKSSKISLLADNNKDQHWSPWKELNAQGFKSYMSLIAPCIFKGQNGENIYVMATLSPDSILAIWRSDLAKPFYVVNDVSAQPIQDFCWSQDSRMLILTPTSGSPMVAVFNDDDFGEPILDLATSTKILNEKTLSIIPIEFETMTNWRQKTNVIDKENAKNVKNDEKKDRSKPLLTVQANGGTSERGNNIVEKSSDATASRSTPIPSLNDETQTSISTSTAAPKILNNFTSTVEKLKEPATESKKMSSTSSMVAGNSRGNSTNNSNASKKRPISHTDFDLPSSSVPKDTHQKIHKVLKDDSQSSRRKREVEPTDFVGSVIINPQLSYAKVRIATPRVKSTIRYNCGDDESLQLEVQNGNGLESQPSRVALYKGKPNEKDQRQPVFVDFISQKVHIVTGSSQYWAISTVNGQVIIYSDSGRRIIPTIVLGSPLSFLELKGEFLLAVSSVGELFTWNLTTRKSLFKPTNLFALLDPLHSNLFLNSNSSSLKESTTNLVGEANGVILLNGELLSRSENLTMCSITKDGIPIVTLSNGNGYLFNADMCTWSLISDSWWAFGSQYWDISRTSGSLDGAQGLLHNLEAHTNEEINRKGKMKFFNKVSKLLLMRDGFENLETMVSLNHIENKINYYLMMNDKISYRSLMITYVSRLAELQLKGRLHELFAELKVTDLPLLKDLLLICSKFKEVQEILVYYAKYTGVVDDMDIL